MFGKHTIEIKSTPLGWLVVVLTNGYRIAAKRVSNQLAVESWLSSLGL